MKKCPSCALLYPPESAFCFLDGATLEANDDPWIGTTIAGRYRVLAAGPRRGWDTQYQAEYRLVAEKCQLTLLNVALEPQQAKAFEEAARLTRRCSHSNILPLLAAGCTATGSAYIVEAASDARRLSDVLTRQRLNVNGAIGLVVQVLEALGRMHDFGSIHGSLQPENVVFYANGHVKLQAAGLGRSLFHQPWDEQPESFAEQVYFAPELSRQLRATAGADIYSAGVLAFHAAAGKLPFAAENVRQLRDELAQDAPLDLAGRFSQAGVTGLPEQVIACIERMMAPDPKERPNTAHQALVELREACRAGKLAVAADPGHADEENEARLPDAFGRWETLAGVFKQMHELAASKGASPSAQSSYEQLCSKLEALQGIGKKGVFEFESLRAIENRARAGREDIAKQMAEINESCQEIREEIAPLQIAAGRHGTKAEPYGQMLIEQHKQLVQWEGRSGFTEPYKELADAYRASADLVDKWFAIRSAQLQCERESAQKNEQLHEFDQQLEELRQALGIHESNVRGEREASEASLAESGQDADRIEMDLLDLASRFTAPLRSIPELGQLFQELSKG